MTLSTSGWWLDGIRLFVSESKIENGQIVPRLQPLGGATILQTFGYESEVKNLSAIVVGDVDMAALNLLITTGSGYVLDSPEGVVGSDYIVKNVTASRIHTICQTIRPDLDSESPVYQVEIQLYDD